MKILVIGATGYVGGRLVTPLLEAGHDVRCLARNPARAERYEWSGSVEVVKGDVLDADTLAPAFDGCDVVYFLVHSIDSGGDFGGTEARSAEHVRDATASGGLRRIVYLGGMGDDEHLSEHLASRHRVGEILASGPTPVTELRAAVIIGSGSVSFEMLRYLTEMLPVMVVPRWVGTRCQPIAIRDVLHYLVGVLDDHEKVDRVLDIGGPDVVTYREMMQEFASVAGLPRRIILPVPLLSPRLSSLWIGLVTPLPSSMARPLVDSLSFEVVMRDRAVDEVVAHTPITFRHALELAMAKTRAEAVDTRWSDAGFTPADTLPGDPEWSGGTLYCDTQTVDTEASPDALYEAFARIGGSNGYYVVGWAWTARGFLDRLVGGPGLRRGRRHPLDLRPGEAIDFWRVVDVEPGVELVLEAEMRLPGRAWLSWRIEPADDGRTRLVQTAWFAPKGLFGRVYWYAMFPFHWSIFAGMARSIVHRASQHSSAVPSV